MKSLPNKYERLINGFSKTVKTQKRKLPRPIVVAPFGPCCVGKTTAMTYLARRIPAVHLNHDQMRLFMKKRSINNVNEVLYKYHLIIRLSIKYLRLGYSVIIDRDFGTNNKDFLNIAAKETKKLGVKFFLIGIKAPKKFIQNKILTRKLIPEKLGGIPDRKTAMDCYLYSLQHYRHNYKKLSHRAVAMIDASKSLPEQFKRVINILKTA